MKRNVKWQFCIILWLYLVTIAFGCSRPPSDKNMQKHFIDNKEIFGRLIQMLQEDKTVNWISEQFILPEGSLKPERKGQYLGLMNKAGVRHISIKSRANVSGTSTMKSEKHEVGPVSFGTFNSSGVLKGYTYSTQTLSPIYDSLDERPVSLKAYEFGYKRISDDWYLYLSSTG